MSQQNVETVARAVDAMNRGHPESNLELVDDAVVFEPLRSSVEGAYHGLDGVRNFFTDTAETFETFQVAYTDVRDLGERVLAIGTIRVRGRDSGAEAEVVTASLYTFREGRVVRYKDYGDSRAALDAAGLGE